MKKLLLIILLSVISAPSLTASNLSGFLKDQTTHIVLPLTVSMFIGRAAAHFTSPYFYPNELRQSFFKVSKREALEALPFAAALLLAANQERTATPSLPFFVCLLTGAGSFAMKKKQDRSTELFYETRARETEEHTAQLMATLEAERHTRFFNNQLPRLAAELAQEQVVQEVPPAAQVERVEREEREELKEEKSMRDGFHQR